MWFKLAGATFTNNLGTMDSISKSYMMDYSGLTGLSASPGSVSYASDSTPDATITFTVKSGYVFKSGSKVTASGGASKTYTASTDIVAGSSFTMALTGISNKVTFVGAAELVSGGNTGGSGGSEPETPVNPPSGGGTGVTIDVSARTTSNSHADALPAGITSATNLWTALTPEAKYYDSTGTYTSYNSVSSVVFPVKPGDKITASSFGTTKESNGTSHTGIRITYLLDNTVVNSLTANTVASEYKSNGYVTVPSGVNAVNIPVWDNTVTGHEVYLFPVEATSGTPTKPSNDNSGSGGGSGSGSGGNAGVEDTSGATWYVNHLANGSKCTANVNIAGRGWAHVPGSAAYSAYVGKPVNTIGFFTNLASQNVTIGKVVEKGGVDAMETIATVTAVNPSGTAKGFCYITFPTVTLAEGECLVMFAQDDDKINFYYNGSGSLTDANGIVDTNFYGRVPKVYGSGTAWTAYPTQEISLGISVGYIAS